MAIVTLVERVIKKTILSKVNAKKADLVSSSIISSLKSIANLAIAWTLFKGKSREVFQTMLPLDSSTWARGRAWTLWMETIQHWHVIINEVLRD